MADARTYESVLAELKEFPERHQHTNMNDLRDCCFLDGAVDLTLIDLHSHYVDMGSNGGRRCDVREGPCSCGTSH